MPPWSSVFQKASAYAAKGLSAGARGVGYGQGLVGLARSGQLGYALPGAAIGGLAGAAQGMYDQNTSVLGGALMGASLGAAGGFGMRMGRAGLGAYRQYSRMTPASWQSRSGAAAFVGKSMKTSALREAQHLSYAATSSAGLIGNSTTRAFNRIRGMF